MQVPPSDLRHSHVQCLSQSSNASLSEPWNSNHPEWTLRQKWHFIIQINIFLLWHQALSLMASFLTLTFLLWGFPGGSDCKQSACRVRDPGSFPGLGRSLGEGNANPLQYSRLENAMDGGTWQATVQGLAKCSTPLSNFTLPILNHRTEDTVWVTVPQVSHGHYLYHILDAKEVLIIYNEHFKTLKLNFQ